MSNVNTLQIQTTNKKKTTILMCMEGYFILDNNKSIQIEIIWKNKRTDIKRNEKIKQNQIIVAPPKSIHSKSELLIDAKSKFNENEKENRWKLRAYEYYQ